jgi:hypothetical protein
MIKHIRKVDAVVKGSCGGRVGPRERSEISGVVNVFIARVDVEVESRTVREEGTIVFI